MHEENGFNGYGFCRAFKWCVATDGIYKELHPDDAPGSFNPDLLSSDNNALVRKQHRAVRERVDNVTVIFAL